MMKPLTPTRKKILIFAAVLLSGIIVFVILFFVQNKSYDKIPVLKATPPEASFIIQIDDFNSFFEATAFFKPLSVWRNIPKINDHFEQLGKIISLIGTSKQSALLSKQAKLVISVIHIDDDYDFLFAIEMTDVHSFKEVVTGIDPFGKPLGYSHLNERKGENRIELFNETDTVHIGHLSNIILISKNITLIKQSLLRLENVEKNPWEDFSNVENNENTLFTLFTRDGSLHRLIDFYFYDDRMFPAEFIPDSGYVKFCKSNETLQLEMEGNFNHEVLNFPIDFQELYLWRNGLTDVAFATTGSLKASALPTQIQPLLGETFYEVIFWPQPGDSYPSSLMLINVIDTSAFLKNAKSITEKLPADIEKEFYFQDCFAAKLKHDSIFKHYENTPKNLQPNKYIVLCGHTLLVSPFASAIEKATEDYMFMQSDTLKDDFDMNEYSLYMHLPGFYPFLMISANENQTKTLEELYPVISHYTHIKYYTNPEKPKIRIVDIHFDDNGPLSTLKEVTNLRYSKFLWRNESIFAPLMNFPTDMFEDQENGNQNFFYPDSSLMAQGIYEMGEATGTWRFHYPDSSYQATIEFDKGKPHGKAVFYRIRPTKKMLVSCAYEKGEFSGQYIEFHKNGKPALSVVYKNGKISGKTRCYYPGGTIMAEVDFTGVAGEKQYLLYTITGDFIDPEIFSAPSLILRNFIPFISTQRMALGK